MSFITATLPSYTFSIPSLFFGKALYQGSIVSEFEVRVPLKTMNRHGLIAGATGTGKTKTLQLLTEQLSMSGVPTVVMDIKGDFSGISQAGKPDNPKILDRYRQLGIPYVTQSFPTEFYSLDQHPGVKLKSTLYEFGPILLSKILDLSEVQASIVSVLFHYADKKQLPIVDLADFKSLLQWASSTGKKEIETEFGKMSSVSISTVLRQMIALESQGANTFFGQPSFEIFDWMKINNEGKGIVNVIRLMSMQDRPLLFSTFMLSLLAEMFEVLPEVGDLEKPKLVMMLDEAHLLFKDASKELLSQIETTIKLIRSKGVGIFFCTQLPDDIPDAVLSQLGLKVQHALRAFTAKDRQAIKKAVENYPISEYYDLDTLVTSLGIGETMITCLDEKGVPTPVVHTFMATPSSRMDVITDDELQSIVNNSLLTAKYNRQIDEKTAHEMLQEDIDTKILEKNEQLEKKERSVFEKVLNSRFAHSIGRQVGNSIVRGLLGKIGLKIDGRTSFF